MKVETKEIDLVFEGISRLTKAIDARSIGGHLREVFVAKRVNGKER